MIRKLVLALLFGASLIAAAVAGEDPSKSKPAAWGHVGGQVILDADLDDPRLQRFFDDLPLVRPLSLPVPLGAKPEVVNRIPNDRLIVDKKTKGVKNAFVFVADRPERVHPSYAKESLKPVKLTYTERRFRPRVFSIEVGQPLELIADKDGGEATNFLGRFARNQNFNLLVPPDGNPRKWSARNLEPGKIPSRIESSIYQTAEAYCLIKDHPYVAITDRLGRFELENLPAGTHELVIWHETVGYVVRSLRIDIEPGETAKLKPARITIDDLER